MVVLVVLCVQLANRHAHKLAQGNNARVRSKERKTILAAGCWTINDPPHTIPTDSPGCLRAAPREVCCLDALAARLWYWAWECGGARGGVAVWGLGVTGGATGDTHCHFASCSDMRTRACASAADVLLESCKARRTVCRSQRTAHTASGTNKQRRSREQGPNKHPQ